MQEGLQLKTLIETTEMLKRMKKQKSYINFFDKPEWEILVPEEYFGCYIVFIVVSMKCLKFLYV